MKKLPGVPEPTSLKEMQDQTMAEKVAALLAVGISQAEIQRQLGMSPNKLYRLMDKHPEIVRKVHDDVKKRATLMRHKTLSRLEEIRDQDDNLNAAVKAADAIDKRAGINFQEHESGVTVQIFGESVKVGDTRGSDLREIAREMAARLGPEYERIIEAEFSLDSAREGKVGEPGRAPGGTPEDRQDSAGT